MTTPTNADLRAFHSDSTLRHQVGRPIKRARTYRREFVNGAGKMRHRVIAERALGRPLPIGAEVHHVDGDRHALTPRLVICESHQYHALLHARQRVLRAGGNPDAQAICSRCHRLVLLTDFHHDKSSRQGRKNKCRLCVKAMDANRRRNRTVPA